MFRIGEFSKLSNITVRMLRNYDEIGLLVPKEVDTDSNYRYYAASQLDTANKIVKLKAMGFSLGIIAEIISNQGDVKTVKAILNTKAIELAEEREKIEMQSKMLSRITEIIGEDVNYMKYNVERKTIAGGTVASLRKVMPGFQDEGTLWGNLFGTLGKAGIQPSKAGKAMTFFHDSEYKEENVDVEVQAAIDGVHEDMGDVKFITRPDIDAVSVTFTGAYEQMPDVMQAIGQWFEDNGEKPSNLMFNIMHVSPGEDPNPANWVTEACLAIAK